MGGAISKDYCLVGNGTISLTRNRLSVGFGYADNIIQRGETVFWASSGNGPKGARAYS